MADKTHALRVLETDLLDVIERMEKIASNPVLTDKMRETFGLACLNAAKAYAETCIARKRESGEWWKDWKETE